MSIEWYTNSKTGEIDSYEVSGSLTDFPRGVLLAYGDYITTGFKSKQDAEKWASEWSACPKCKSARHGKPGDLCQFCKNPLVNAAQQSVQSDVCPTCDGSTEGGSNHEVGYCPDCNGTGKRR